MSSIDDGPDNQVRVRHKPGIHIDNIMLTCVCLSGWNAVYNLAEFIDICANSRLQLKLFFATPTKQADVISISSERTQGLCNSCSQLVYFITKINKSRHQASIWGAVVSSLEILFLGTRTSWYEHNRYKYFYKY